MEIFQIVRHVMTFFLQRSDGFNVSFSGGIFPSLGGHLDGLNPRALRIIFGHPKANENRPVAPGYVVCWGFLGG